MENTIDSLEAVMKGDLLRDSIDQARAAQLQRQIDSIVAQDYVENGWATNYYVFVNKAWPEDLDANRNGLLAIVYEETGQISLLSTMPNTHIERPDHIEVEVADKKYVADTSATRPLNGPDENGHTALRDAKGEVIHIDAEISMKIVQAIAANPNAEVTVNVMNDGHSYAYFTLSEEDKKAIIASYKLLLMIKERNALEGGNVEWDD